MIELIIFVIFALLLLVTFEWYARKKAKEGQSENTQKGIPTVFSDGECCGEHLVCEKETLLQTNAQIEYYDDEELDALAGIDPKKYTQQQYQTLREVFDSLQGKDVAGWCRSIQLRNIALPQDIREEALLIVRDRRHMA